MFLSVTGVTVIVVVLATVLVTVIPLSSFTTTGDRLAWTGDVLVGATLLLAAIAAIVALVAYAVSTGLPDIQIKVELTESDPNDLAFEAKHGYETSGELGSDVGKVLLRNESGYSAKNPALIVRLHEIILYPPEGDTDWAVIDSEWYEEEDFTVAARKEVSIWQGSTAIQWDGGPTYSIHGHSTRRLPDIKFLDLRYLPPRNRPAALTFEILAEGYRKIVFIPVDIIVDGKSLYPREDRNIIVDGKSLYPREDGNSYPEWI
jgi:hypothetical protein